MSTKINPFVKLVPSVDITFIKEKVSDFFFCILIRIEQYMTWNNIAEVTF